MLIGTWLRKPSIQHVKGICHQVTLPGRYRSASGVVYTVPEGFITDGASVPRPLWWLYPPFGDDYEAGATLHDYLYRFAEDFDGMTRAQADFLLWESSIAAGFRATGARVIWLGVRVGGWKPWGLYRRESGWPEQAA